MAESLQRFAGAIYQIGSRVSEFVLSGAIIAVHIVPLANGRNCDIQQSQRCEENSFLFCMEPQEYFFRFSNSFIFSLVLYYD